MNIQHQLEQLLSLHCENEIVEFKTASNNFHSDKLGQYFSALSNEANLQGVEQAWLVLGADDRQQVWQKANYTRNTGFDKQYYLDLIRKAIAQHGALSRAEVDELLWNKLPEMRTDKRKKYKVGNLLAELRRTGVIRNAGTQPQSSWVLVKN